MNQTISNKRRGDSQSGYSLVLAVLEVSNYIPNYILMDTSTTFSGGVLRGLYLRGTLLFCGEPETQSHFFSGLHTPIGIADVMICTLLRPEKHGRSSNFKRG